MTVIAGKHILLGVTGSIAAYKAADLASKLTQAGAQVEVILTAAGEKFITPLTFQSVTGRRAYTDNDLWGNEAHVLHISLGRSADVLVIAPCTADTLAKLAHGNADNLLTITALAATCPMLVAPAMDGGMLEHPATRENLEKLGGRGVMVIGPAEGHLASGLSGKGRMLEPDEILGHLRIILGRQGQLAGKKVVISAGGTMEPFDPVRVLTNRSSGKQGYALAQAALDAGAQVVLISAPTSIPPPVGTQIIKVETVEEMKNAVLSACRGSDVLIMAAAAADFRPKHSAQDKLKKRDGVPKVEFEAAPDILKEVAAIKIAKDRPGCVVGFAAESRDLLQNATEKMKSKQLDLMVANDISEKGSGFSADTNRVTLLFPDGKQEPLPLMQKSEVAEAVIKYIANLVG
ncbi:MAG: phosphopantothenoylcysteine decarboxylase [Chloroflexi bacterium RBG_16_51_16]|nr:MAG: phosphopantothenoylcysteine decarboxylase [Chloroflexi bacterium RBG_16_51_16]